MIRKQVHLRATLDLRSFLWRNVRKLELSCIRLISFVEKAQRDRNWLAPSHRLLMIRFNQQSKILLLESNLTPKIKFISLEDSVLMNNMKSLLLFMWLISIYPKRRRKKCTKSHKEKLFWLLFNMHQSCQEEFSKEENFWII